MVEVQRLLQHTFFQSFAELIVGSLELLCLDRGRVVFRDRVNQTSKSLFQALEAGVDIRVHLVYGSATWIGRQRGLLSTCKRETRDEAG